MTIILLTVLSFLGLGSSGLLRANTLEAQSAEAGGRFGEGEGRQSVTAGQIPGLTFKPSPKTTQALEKPSVPVHDEKDSSVPVSPTQDAPSEGRGGWFFFAVILVGSALGLGIAAVIGSSLAKGALWGALWGGVAAGSEG